MLFEEFLSAFFWSSPFKQDSVEKFLELLQYGFTSSLQQLCSNAVTAVYYLNLKFNNDDMNQFYKPRDSEEVRCYE